ncbi:MAG: DUF4340 domain-containing protein [Steroidobacteraceae bacterium]
MTRRHFSSLLIGALVVILGALYLNSNRNPHAPEVQGLALLPALAGELDTVTALTVRRGGAAPVVTVHKVAGQWTVAERDDYPADVAKLRKLLLALGEAKIVEEKTSSPANFSIIGVEDPAQSGATSAQVTVTARDGEHSVIVGKPAGPGYFARRAGQNQSYLVEPPVSLETEPRYWIESRLIDVPTKSIQSVEIKPPTGAGYVIHRLKPGEEGFDLDGTPAGRKAIDANELAPSATLLSSLNAEDVAAASGIDFSNAARAIITLTGGDAITLLGTSVADKHWIKVWATKDAALAAKTKDRAFEVASYRYDAIFRPLEQLLVPKEPKGHGPKSPSDRKPSPAPGP